MISRRPTMPTAAAALALAVWLAVPPARACTVPVGRYALERWPPDVHVLRVRPNVPLQPGMLGKHHANAWVASGQSSQTNDVLVTFPQTDLAWYDGPWRPDLPDALTDSPLRRRIAHDLVTGAMGVCLLLDGDEASTNAAVFAQIQSKLGKLQGSLTLPADPSYDPVSPSSPPPQLRSRIPLKVAFTLHRLTRNAPGEEFLVRQIDAMLPDSDGRAAAKVVFFFGRGRAVAMPPNAPLETSLEEFTHFLCGACSCQVKEMNPGLDLLMTANWDDAVGNYPTPAESSLASGASFRFGGELRSPDPAGPTGAVTRITADVAPTAPPRPAPVSSPPAATPSPETTLWILVGLAVLVILALAALFLRGNRRD